MSTQPGIRSPPGLACIACAGQQLVSLGRLPVFTPDFLGRDLDSGTDPGTLYECASCTIRFRAPQPTTEELMHYYQGMDVAECWQHGPEREVWRYIKDALQSLPDKSVLDVGCFRGEMLNYLGNGFERFGVEPSKEAAEKAQKHGVKIIADSIESLRDSALRFGAITLIDVAEHLPRPLESLQLLSRLLLPGGKLIIFTGNTDAISWRLAGRHYYYSAMPEHVAFMRPSWFHWAAGKMNCHLFSIRRLRYQPSNWRNRMDEAFKNLLYIGYHRLQRLPFVAKILSSTPAISRIGQWKGCWWTSAKDHILVTMTRI